MEHNTTLLEADLRRLSALIQRRILHLIMETSEDIEVTFDDPQHYPGDPYALMISRTQLSTYERITLALALSCYVMPEMLDPFYMKNKSTNTTYTQFGGKSSPHTSAFLPTGETALFLCVGTSLSPRIDFRTLFAMDQPLYQFNLLRLGTTREDEPPLSGRIIPTDECLHWVLYQDEYQPHYARNFPAKLLETKLTWNDLVLNYDTNEALNEMFAWLAHHHEMEQISTVNRKFKRGYKALFYGPSGTGKTLTATLIGQKFQMEVYHVDLSMMVSKYIGETEKNLKNIFDVAENKNWILFFDEADALFGKRTQTSSSNDRYANQEVSYLLQRVEDYPGMVILASNLKANMDKAFYRRFQSIIYFPMPDISERHLLWQKAFSEHLKLEENINLRELAKNHEISGAAISNVLRFCTLMALQRKSNVVTAEDIATGISRELGKEGKLS